MDMQRRRNQPIFGKDSRVYTCSSHDKTAMTHDACGRTREFSNGKERNSCPAESMCLAAWQKGGDLWRCQDFSSILP